MTANGAARDANTASETAGRNAADGIISGNGGEFLLRFRRVAVGELRLDLDREVQVRPPADVGGRSKAGSDRLLLFDRGPLQQRNDRGERLGFAATKSRTSLPISAELRAPLGPLSSDEGLLRKFTALAAASGSLVHAAKLVAAKQHDAAIANTAPRN